MPLSDYIFDAVDKNDLSQLNVELEEGYADPFDLKCAVFETAYKNKNFNIVQRLLKERKKFESFHPETVFSLAIENKDEETIKTLLSEYREELNFSYSHSKIFMSACISGNVFLVKLILDEEVDSNLSKISLRAFECAIKNHRFEVVKILLNNNTTKKEINIMTLKASIDSMNEDIFDIIFNHFKESNHQNFKFRQLIYNAIQFNNMNIMKKIFNYFLEEQTSETEQYINDNLTSMYNTSASYLSINVLDYLFENYSGNIKFNDLSYILSSALNTNDLKYIRATTKNKVFKKILSTKNEHKKIHSKNKIINAILEYCIKKLDINLEQSIINEREIIMLSSHMQEESLMFLSSYKEFTKFYNTKWINKNIKNPKHKKILKIGMNIDNF